MSSCFLVRKQARTCGVLVYSSPVTQGFLAVALSWVMNSLQLRILGQIGI